MILEFYLGDNDYGLAAQSAARELYRNVKRNNEHLLCDGLTLADLFVGLNEADQLAPMFRRLLVLFQHIGGVEHCTRGLHDKEREPIRIVDVGVVGADMCSLESYFGGVKATFREAPLLVWENGEVVCLDLLSGNVSMR